MRTDALHYELPPRLIAQRPLEERDDARLLVGGASSEPSHRHVRDLPSLLEPGDLLVVNTTKVLPARVPITRPGGGTGEVLLLEERSAGWWEALCRPSRKLARGSTVRSTGGALGFEMGADLGDGRRLVRPTPLAGSAIGHDEPVLLAALARDGRMPLPPYIHESLIDPHRYQTIYAQRPGSAAAPTAGLHLTSGVMDELRNRGVGVATVELVVGLDTFRPVSTELVEDHPIHSERYNVPEQTWHEVGTTRMQGGRVTAVGTTTTRALESVTHTGDLAGRTDLFITPGFEFRVVDRLMTNFHLPCSSLLAMVEAFVGPCWRDLYELAACEEYRFLSFGDAMLLDGRPATGP